MKIKVKKTRTDKLKHKIKIEFSNKSVQKQNDTQIWRELPHIIYVIAVEICRRLFKRHISIFSKKTTRLFIKDLYFY